MDSENATINFSPSGGSNQQPSAWPSALTVAPHTRAENLYEDRLSLAFIEGEPYDPVTN